MERRHGFSVLSFTGFHVLDVSGHEFSMLPLACLHVLGVLGHGFGMPVGMSLLAIAAVPDHGTDSPSDHPDFPEPYHQSDAGLHHADPNEGVLC